MTFPRPPAHSRRGLDNYVKLAGHGFFRRAIANSLVFTFASVAVKLLPGMAMAVVLTSKISSPGGAS